MTEKKNIEVNLEEELEDSQVDKYFTFLVNNQSYGIEILNISEIIGIQKITPLPMVEDHIKGIINLRGLVIPVLDVRTRFGIEEEEYHDRTCIVVVNFEEKYMGLIVDSVSEVTIIPEENITPSSSGLQNEKSNRFIRGMGKIEEKVVIILEPEKLLFEDDYIENK